MSDASDICHVEIDTNGYWQTSNGDSVQLFGNDIFISGSDGSITNGRVNILESAGLVSINFQNKHGHFTTGYLTAEGDQVLFQNEEIWSRNDKFAEQIVINHDQVAIPNLTIMANYSRNYFKECFQFNLENALSSYQDMAQHIGKHHIEEMESVISENSTFGKVMVLKKIWGDHHNLIYKMVHRIPEFASLEPATSQRLVECAYVSIMHLFVVTTYKDIQPELLTGIGIPPKMISEGKEAMSSFMTINLDDTDLLLLAALLVLSPITVDSSAIDIEALKTWRGDILESISKKLTGDRKDPSLVLCVVRRLHTYCVKYSHFFENYRQYQNKIIEN